MKMLNIAIIGLGVISNIHMDAIRDIKEAKLVALCDCDESKGSEYGDLPFYTDYQIMLEKEQIDCVHICLPHHLHFPVAKDCLERGVHVMEEKPLALNTKEALQLVEVAEKSVSKLGICFQNRCNPSIVKMLEMIRNNEYGTVLGVKGIVAWNRPISYFEEAPWRSKLATAGSGVMINQAIHVLDIMQLIGGEVESIKGSTSNIHDFEVEVEDTAVANLKFKNGVKGLFLSSIANSFNSNVEIEVECENGKLIIRDNALYGTYKDKEKTLIVNDSMRQGEKFYYGASHRKTIEDFYRCIINNTDHYITAKEAMKAIEIIDCIKRSSRSGEWTALKE